ncbi:hypothetical protein CU633_07865 [Bacillus sp. V3-13]|nr:hypothetical protein CU633_07865 [Bacillus sp. V3-13]
MVLLVILLMANTVLDVVLIHVPLDIRLVLLQAAIQTVQVGVLIAADGGFLKEQMVVINAVIVI